jgi:hypothetical protein
MPSRAASFVERSLAAERGRKALTRQRAHVAEAHALGIGQGRAEGPLRLDLVAELEHGDRRVHPAEAGVPPVARVAVAGDGQLGEAERRRRVSVTERPRRVQRVDARRHPEVSSEGSPRGVDLRDERLGERVLPVVEQRPRQPGDRAHRRRGGTGGLLVGDERPRRGRRRHRRGRETGGRGEILP